MNEVLDEGKDLGNFLWEMIKHTKDILMYKVSKIAEIYNEEEIKEISQISEKVSKEELINIIYRLSELENKMKWSSQKTIIFETEIIKLCMKQDTKSLEERVEKLEKLISEGIKISTTNAPNNQQVARPRYETQTNNTNNTYVESPKIEPKKIQEKKEETKKEFKPSVNLSEGNIITNWPNVLNDLKKQGKVILYANLVNTEAVEINDMTVGIRFNSGLNSFRKELLQKPENMSVITKEVSIVCGKPMQIKLEDASGSKKITPQPQVKVEPVLEENNKEEDILESLDIPINFIEE